MRNGWFLVSVIATLLAFAAGLAVHFEVFGLLPERVPVHWDIHGQPDSFVPRAEALPYLLLAPAGMVVLDLLTLALPWLSPRGYDIKRFGSTYAYIMALVVLMMGYIQAVFLLVTLGVHIPFLRVYLGGMFLFFAALGNVLGKVQRNFWIGVRTPWTLASEAVWIRTHRFAAWNMTLGGLIGFLLSLLGAQPFYPLAAVVVILIATLAPVIYSLILYKSLEKQGRLNGPHNTGDAP